MDSTVVGRLGRPEWKSDNKIFTSQSKSKFSAFVGGGTQTAPTRWQYSTILCNSSKSPLQNGQLVIFKLAYESICGLIKFMMQFSFVSKAECMNVFLFVASMFSVFRGSRLQRQQSTRYNAAKSVSSWGLILLLVLFMWYLFEFCWLTHKASKKLFCFIFFKFICFSFVSFLFLQWSDLILLLRSMLASKAC